ncbi:hypothetical protein GGS23DRAFT_615964 [Durotheca rogersii]|uniref:uncharacterized protein n=1 Tax=Durotheca rogersii TaxID=419775 RepID=UPI00221EB46A|nr:uncharacterized protein GGS23DRAFT_615964 [Durotheca rogersii]KAI5859565.1 hypothetical protein GGS23DRAFT_615964 [Durotheca rogersii]
MAILTPALAHARAAHDEARRISAELRVEFEALSRGVEPGVELDEEEGEPDPKAAHRLALLRIELFLKEKEALRLERDVIAEERDAGILHPKAAGKRMGDLNQRYLSAGDGLWRYQRKEIRSDDTGMIWLLDPRLNIVSERLWELYRKYDGSDEPAKRTGTWGRDAKNWYAATGDHHGMQGRDAVWCHVSGKWYHKEDVKAAHIVPFFLDGTEIGEILFGSMGGLLGREGNALLMLKHIKIWFDTYHLVIVPVDANETPITRWRIELLSPNLRKCVYHRGHTLGELDGKELVFLNGKRPVLRFVYFHFIMALICIKDLKREGWEDVWARYYTRCPFPTPGPCMRKSVLLALAIHFGAADLRVVESWVGDNGLESPLKLAEEETTKAAHRVHSAVKAAYDRAEHPEASDQENSEGRSEDDPEE